MEVYYQVTEVTVGDRYKCGACPFISYDVKNLHFHIKQHSEGSFYFCQDTNTAYPRFRSTDACTQTELLVEITSDDIIRTGNSLRFIPELNTSVVKPELEQENQLSPEKAVEPGPSLLPDDISEALEEIDDYSEIETAVIKQDGDVEGEGEGSSPLVEIPLSYKSMSSEELLNVLLHEDPDVPDQKKGKKNYMVIQTEGYKAMGMFDDGVSWDSHSKKSTKQCYAIDVDYKLSQIFKKGLSYYVKRMHNKQSQYEIIQPQPANVVTFQKISINLQGNESYRRRITTVVEAPIDMGFLINKGVVEYYMDITSIQKVSGRESNVNVTLPDCTKLKEMLYPSICKEIPSTSTPLKSTDSNTRDDDQTNPWTPVGTELAETEDPSLVEVTEKPCPPIATGFQYMNNDEQLQVLMNEGDGTEEEEDGIKNYKVFMSKSNGFQKRDDYGLWRVISTSTLTLSVGEGNQLTPVTKKNFKYYVSDWKNKNEVGEELSPQPTDLLVLQRCSFKLAGSMVFKKRETIVWSAPDRLSKLQNKHLVEYISIKSLVPKVEADENGKTKLVVQQHLLRACDFKAEMSDDSAYHLDVSNIACAYMSNEDLLERLILDDTERKSAFTCGKNYMVIKNEKATKKTQFYLKDGCVWSSKSGTTINQSFAIDDENNIRGVMKKEDQYCVKKRLNRKTVYEPLSPQPAEILTFHKYWTSLKSNPIYKKRVTSVSEAPERLEYLKSKVLVEYYMDKSNMKTPLSIKSKAPLDHLKWKLENVKSELIDDESSQSVKRKFSEVSDKTDDMVEESMEEDVNETINESSHEELEENIDCIEIQLPVTNMFMNAQEIWKTLNDCETPAKSIMSSTHEKDYIIVSGGESDEYLISAAYQDGLFWDGVNFGLTKQDFIFESGKIGKLVYNKDGVFCIAKKENKQTVYEALKPQPKHTVRFCRSWTRLKSMPWYRKRVTRLTNLPNEFSFLKNRVLIEYCLEKCKISGIEDDVELLNSLNNDDSVSKKQNKTPGKKRIEDVREMLDIDDLGTPEPIAIETPTTHANKSTESLYDKPYMFSPDVSKVSRSERVKQREMKRLKVEQEDSFDDSKASSSPQSPFPKIVNADEDSGQMMSVDEVFETLQSSETFSSVKDRPLNKNFILVEVDPQAPDRKRVLNDNFAWNSSTGTTTDIKFCISKDDKLTPLVEKKGVFYMKVRSDKHYGRVVHKHLSPQPTQIVTLHRYYVKGKGAQTFMKRVTSVKEAPERLDFLKSRVLVEYSTSERMCFKKSM